MTQLGCPNLEAFLITLDKDDSARLPCERLLTVSISRFFRDRRLWEILKEQILPKIIEENREKINIWSAGCASGEEVYSLKILWTQMAQSGYPLPRLEITATDLNQNYLERAIRGIYPPSSLREIPEQSRCLYFEKSANKALYQVKASFKEGITWRQHNLLDDPPVAEFHLIFLRNNILTYYEYELRERSFRKAIRSLKTGGFLIIGSHEQLPHSVPDLVPFGSVSYVFRKKR